MPNTFKDIFIIRNHDNQTAETTATNSDYSIKLATNKGVDSLDYFSIDTNKKVVIDYKNKNNKKNFTIKSIDSCSSSSFNSPSGSNSTSRSISKINDNDYDSTGQNKTDESSPDEEDLENKFGFFKSNCNVETCPCDIKSSQNRLRGILKYPPGWPKRTLSESDASMFQHSISSDDYGYFGTSVESPEILLDCFEFEGVDDDSGGDLNKPKKCVTFSEKMATYVFRPGSCILGRKQKNQKKAKKKKERALKKLSSSPRENSKDFEDEDDDCSCFKRITNDIDAVKIAIDSQRSGKNSSYDDIYSTDISSSSSGCDTSASECSSADEMNNGVEESLRDDINYVEESKSDANGTISKSKRKNRRRRNRKNKLTMKTFLETGGYDSD